MTGISEALLSEFAESVSARTGLYFPKERWRDLEHGVNSAAVEFGLKDAESCIQRLVTSQLTKEQIEILASYLTVGETYFFREKKSFEVLEEHILPELIRSRMENERHLRIWSAGCATGEEPYSIAILLDKIIPELEDWNITILATDINPRFLQKAQKGTYGEWSFRDSPEWIKKYFRKTKHGFELSPDIKKMVTFSYHNLAEDTYPSLLNNTTAMDIIFCRNVLMYFAPERAKEVVQKFYCSLVDGGWLVVSPCETSHILFSQFKAANFSGVTLYKKDTSRLLGIKELIPKEIYHPPHAEEILPGLPEPVLKEIAVKEKAEEPDLYDEALTLYGQGRYAQAAEKIVGLASHDHDAKAIILLARTYANQGKLALAHEWCEKALAIEKLNPGCYYLLATIELELGKVEEAAKSLKRALYLDQNFVIAHFALANLRRMQGKFKEAEKYFGNALALLRGLKKEAALPEAEGMTAGRLSEIITSMRNEEFA